MELRQLAYFDAVARHGHFTRAAEQLRVAQPAISAQIRRLESELGTQLFNRTTRRVELTHAGELFWVHARKVIDELRWAREELTELTKVLRGQVRLGALPALGPFDLPACLAAFQAQYPGVGLWLYAADARQAYEALRRGDLDLALCLEPEEPTDLVVRPLFHDELVLTLPPGHALAHRQRLRIGDLRDEPFISMPVGSALRTRLTNAAAADGFQPRVQFETRDLNHVRALVSHGLGVALLPRSLAEAAGAPVGTSTVAPEPLIRMTALIHRAERTLSPAAAALRNYLIDLATRTT